MLFSRQKRLGLKLEWTSTKAGLSGFLTRTKITDPCNGEVVERFELERRANDLSSLVRYGLVYELQRMHLPAVH